MMLKVRLYGRLAAFGDEFRFDVETPHEAVRALMCVLPGFRQTLSEGSYMLTLGGDDIEAGRPLDLDSVTFGLGWGGVLHIEPEAVGAKRGGIGKIILGVALVAVAFIAMPAGAGLGATAFSVAGASVSFGQIALFGVMMALQGVSGMLAGEPEQASFEQRERPDQRPSFLFNGPVNTSEQGGPVPLVYGRMLTGSVVASSGITSENF